MDKPFTGLILALDLATVTGYATGCPGQTPKFGAMRFGKPGTPRDQSYRMLRTWLDIMLTNLDPDLVVFESPAIATALGGRTTVETIKKLIGMCEHLEEMCYDRVELREANIRQVRAFFLGGANLKREQAKAATIAKCHSLGVDVKTDDEGDAVALWYYQVACIRPDLAHKTTPLFGKRQVTSTW